MFNKLLLNVNIKVRQSDLKERLGECQKKRKLGI